MRLNDVVTQLKIVIPKYTSLFSSDLTILSVNCSDSTATIQTDGAHNLIDGEEVNISGFSMHNKITSISKDGLVYTFTTNIYHDLTTHNPNSSSNSWHTTVTLGGFDSTDWNSTFTLLSVPNRNTFKIRSTLSLPALSGSEYLLENRIDGVNGQYSATVIDADTFTIEGNFEDSEYTEGSVVKQVRVAGAVNFERALSIYNEMSQNELWLFVVMHDITVSKDRNTYSDGIADYTVGSELILKLLDGFSIYIFGDCSKELSAVDMVSLCRHDLFAYILKSVYGAQFETGLTKSISNFKTVFTGAGTAYYNKSLYAHVYHFESSIELYDTDGVDIGDTRAYRDTNYSSQSSSGTESMTLTIDHDDEPLDR